MPQCSFPLLPFMDSAAFRSARWQQCGTKLPFIRDQHRASLGSYGRPRRTEELNELGLRVGHRRVDRLMHKGTVF